MNTNIKISVTFEIPGATRHFLFMRRKKITLQDTVKQTLPERDANRIVGTAKFPEYEYVNAKRHINMTKEAYDYMTSEEGRPIGYIGKPWRKMSRKERLDYHLDTLAKQFGAYSFSYVILEDDDFGNWRNA